jgi:short-subunit dehydrogenase
LVRYTVLQPEQVAEVAVRALLNGRHEVVPGVFNRMLLWIQTIMPARLREEIIVRQFKKQTKKN